MTLSHRLLPHRPSPRETGELVDKENAVVRWNAPGAEQVEIIIENTDLGHTFDVTVSGSTTRLTIPPQFLRRGKEYTIELLSSRRERQSDHRAEHLQDQDIEVKRR